MPSCTAITVEGQGHASVTKQCQRLPSLICSAVKLLPVNLHIFCLSLPKNTTYTLPSSKNQTHSHIHHPPSQLYNPTQHEQGGGVILLLHHNLPITDTIQHKQITNNVLDITSIKIKLPSTY